MRFLKKIVFLNKTFDSVLNFAKMKPDRVIVYLISGFLIILSVFFIFTTHNLTFHSDSAASNILAREQFVQKSFFPSTWKNSTGIFIFYVNVFMAPLFGLVKNQMLLRDIGILIMALIMYCLIYYMSKFTMDSDFFLLILCLFNTNICYEFVQCLFQQACYTPLVIHDIIYIIFLIRAFDKNYRIKNRICFGLLIVFTVYLGVYGTLGIVYTIFPGLIGLIFPMFLRDNKKSFNDCKESIFGLLKILSLLFLSIVIGIYLYIKLANYYDFKSDVYIIFPEIDDIANSFITFILSSIGYVSGVGLFSLAGIINIITVLFHTILVIFAFKFYMNLIKYSVPVQILGGFALGIFGIYIFFDFFVYCFDDAYRYTVLPLVFLYIISAYYIWEEIYSKGFILKCIVIISICFCCLPNNLANVPQIFEYPKLLEQKKSLSNFLKNNQLERGYATFWNAGNNMVLSDFDIEIAPICLNDEKLNRYEWLTSTRYYENKSHADESFLLLTNEEYYELSERNAVVRLGIPKQIFEFEGYFILDYSYNIAQNDFSGIESTISN